MAGFGWSKGRHYGRFLALGLSSVGCTQILGIDGDYNAADPSNTSFGGQGGAGDSEGGGAGGTSGGATSVGAGGGSSSGGSSGTSSLDAGSCAPGYESQGGACVLIANAGGGGAGTGGAGGASGAGGSVATCDPATCPVCPTFPMLPIYVACCQKSGQCGCAFPAAPCGPMP